MNYGTTKVQSSHPQKNCIAWRITVGGQAALKTGRFPLIKDRETINRRLDGKVKNGEERSYCSILTNTEERMIVEFAKIRIDACKA